MKVKLISLTLIVCLISLMLVSCFGGETAVGISRAEINENGELVLYYSNGSEQNLGVVVGNDGADGVDGIDGTNGTDGKNGTDGILVIDSEVKSNALASAKALRSSVSISCKFEATVQQSGWRPGSGSTSTKSYVSMGSGVIYQLDKEKGDAFIITNYHVVYDASSNTENGISDDISVYIYGSEIEGKAIEATYVGGSLYYDIAILRIEDSEILKASDTCAVEIADPDTVSIGESAIAVGNAKGYGISTSLGVVSVDSEYITMTAADSRTKVSFRVMRVDTAVNSGNSGGGIYNSEGKLMGIVNAKIVEENVENIGYAIPSNVVASIAENIIYYCFGKDTERVQRAALGITVTAVDSRAIYDTETGRIRIEETVSIYDTADGSVAESMFEIGDVLLSATVNGSTKAITREFHALDMMLDLRVGDTVEFNIMRDGEEMTVSTVITSDNLTEY